MPPDEPQRQIGPYTVLQRIGAGGMGTVYLAEQRQPVRRRVALKVLKEGMDSKAFLARFSAERQALAMMEHSCIARVLDAGATEEGQPYLAMEYVKGVPITDYCDDNHLSLKERIDLFRQVCSGVQHAHTKGVMHRDLKPSNVLVTVQDGHPTPKVIDFGLAKAIDHRLVEETLFTEAGQVIGTPEYMSPEQAGIGGLDVDTRTDVYSLGVLLYQLLTGTLPLTRQELLRHGWLEMQRLIREGELEKPSTKITTQGDAATATAKQRRMHKGELERRLRGDLDWIVMKALEKDRSRRYETVQEFAADLLRHERHEPVVAGPPTAGYVLRKLVRRYRAQVVGAAAVLLALAAGLTVAWLQRTEALYQKEQATKNEKIAKAALLDYERLEDLVKLREFEREAAEELLPEGRARLPAMRAWIARVERWREQRPDHREALAQLRQRGTEADGVWRFADDKDRYLHDALQELVQGIGQFESTDLAKDECTEARVRDSMRWSETLHDRTITQAKPEWNEAVARVREDARFGGFELTPQEGLIPLGRSRHGYEEFWFVRSGPKPLRRDGEWVIPANEGMVLVLLPGGQATIGSPSQNPAGRDNPRNELPATTVALAPFFLGKYELTHHQWRQITQRANPNKFGPHLHPSFDRSHPVESLNHAEAVRGLARVGLLLPTEPQWEYACRAGRDTEWYFGSRTADGKRDALLDDRGFGRFNAADGYDARAKGAQYMPEAELWPEFDDRAIVHVPVGSYPHANAFGLFDMHGNVSELTRGTFGPYDKVRFTDGDGELLGGNPERIAHRGGSFWKNVETARCAARVAIARDAKYDNVGIRVTRRVE